jgi:hypothetical protein
MKCLECSIQFEGYHTSRFCSKHCQKIYSDKKYWKKKIEESHKQFNDTQELGLNYVECGLCKYRSKDLAQHSSIHNLSQDEYRNLYGSIKCQEKIDSIKGKNNPWFDHKGSLSPFSKNFIKYNDSESATEIIEELKKKAKQTQTENENNPLTIEYFLKKGFSKELAKESLRERQTTFSLEKCVERFGKEEGLKTWERRQEKWLSTLNNKTIEEKNFINKKKSTKINYKTLWSKSLESRGYFYILKLKDNLFKIGITSKHNIAHRYSKIDNNTYDVLLFSEMKDINHAFQTEQLLKSKYKSAISKSNEVIGFGWTEILKLDNIKQLREDFEKYKADFSHTLKQFDEKFKR